jgi:hypothetical protein
MLMHPARKPIMQQRNPVDWRSRTRDLTGDYHGHVSERHVGHD